MDLSRPAILAILFALMGVAVRAFPPRAKKIAVTRTPSPERHDCTLVPEWADATVRIAAELPHSPR